MSTETNGKHERCSDGEVARYPIAVLSHVLRGLYTKKIFVWELCHYLKKKKKECRPNNGRIGKRQCPKVYIHLSSDTKSHKNISTYRTVHTRSRKDESRESITDQTDTTQAR